MGFMDDLKKLTKPYTEDDDDFDEFDDDARPSRPSRSSSAPKPSYRSSFDLDSDEFSSTGSSSSTGRRTLGGNNSAGYFRQGVDLLVDHESYLLSIHTKFLEDEISDVFAYFHYSLHDVDRFNGLLSPALYQVHGLLYRFLRFDGKIVKVHIFVLLSYFTFLITPKGAQKICQV